MTGIYRTETGHAAIRQWCDQRLREGGLARHEIDTRLGATSVTTTGEGADVVLIPGTNFCSATWVGLLATLGSEYRTTSLDLPGQPGLSAPTRPRDPDAYGPWVGDIINELRLDRPILVGHSLGGRVALDAACGDVPLGGVVLLNPAGLIRLRVPLRLLTATLRWLVRRDVEASAALLDHMTAPGTSLRRDLAEWMALVGRHVRTSLAPSPLPASALARVHYPLRLVTGIHDPFLPARPLVDAFSTFANADHATILPAAGHHLPEEEPSRVGLAVRELTDADAGDRRPDRERRAPLKRSQVERLPGKVAGGVGELSQWMRVHAETYRRATGEDLVPGSLNVELERDWWVPLDAPQIRLERWHVGVGMTLVPCLIGREPAYIARTDRNDTGMGTHAPHVVEIVAAVHLRRALDLKDGDSVEVVVPRPSPPRRDADSPAHAPMQIGTSRTKDDDGMIDPPNALLLVDPQIALLRGPGAVPDAERTVTVLQRLLEDARASRVPVIYLQNDGEHGAEDAPGAPGWPIDPRLEPADGEAVIRKRTDDGFEGTHLADTLETGHVRRLAVVGLLSEMCVSATARSALLRGYAVTIVEDAHATYDLQEIPARTVARVAQHALGDEIDLCSSTRIRFAHPGPT